MGLAEHKVKVCKVAIIVLELLNASVETGTFRRPILGVQTVLFYCFFIYGMY